MPQLPHGLPRGVCLAVEESLLPTFVAYIFDDRFERRHRIVLTGAPSRGRVSLDGRLAAVTVFEQGHSYAEGSFSTRTTFIDTYAGKVVDDLEKFTVWRDGKPFRAATFKFWGVTFARDGDRFFATLGSGTDD